MTEQGLAYEYYDYHYDYEIDTAQDCLQWCNDQKQIYPSTRFTACEYEGCAGVVQGCEGSYKLCSIFGDMSITGGDGDIFTQCWVYSKAFRTHLNSVLIMYFAKLKNITRL